MLKLKYNSILFLDWTSPYCISNSYLKTIIKCILFLFQLIFCKFLLRCKIIHNIHNHHDHELRCFYIEKILLVITYLLVDKSRHFSEYSNESYLYPLNTYLQKGFVVYHPYYEDLIKENFTKKDYLFAFAGNDRSYKGYHDTLSKLTTLNLSIFNKYKIIKLGRSKLNQNYDSDILVTINNYLSEYEFQNYLKRTMFVVLPYKKITTSGLLYLCMSLKIPVITLNSKFFQEILSKEYPLMFNNIDEIVKFTCSFNYLDYDNVKKDSLSYYDSYKKKFNLSKKIIEYIE